MAVVFLVAGFLVVVGFLTEDFFAAGLAAWWGWALLIAVASCRFLRAALFLCITPFLTALSRELWLLLAAASACFLLPLRLVWKDLSAILSDRLVLRLRIVAFLATRTRFLADLMIGM